MTTPSASTPAPPHRVLVAEADAAARRETARALQESPAFRVASEAGSAAEIGDALDRDAFIDLVVFDPSLVEVWEALRRIRDGRGPATVALAARPDEEAARTAALEGAGAYLARPCDANQLRAAVAFALVRREESIRARAENERLHRSLETRKLIERAKGVLMRRHRWSEAEAFRRLQRGAMNRRTTMGDLARQVLDGVVVEL
jgi:AmiR/NasT family two-component response regulator